MALMEINWQPSNRDLRLFAVVQLVVAAVLAWVLHSRWGWSLAAVILIGISLALTITGLVSPKWLRPLFVAWMVAAFPIGWVMSHVLLAIVYFVVITPIGFSLRFSGRDPLQIQPHAEADTYWKPRPAPPAPSRYFRQF
jgi:hypothetical protein